MDETLKTILNYVIPTIGASLIASTPAILSAIKSKQTADKQVEIERARLANESRSTNGSVSKDIADSYKSLVSDLKQRLDDKDKEDQLRDEEIRKLKDGVRALIKQLRRIDPGCTPVFTLD